MIPRKVALVTGSGKQRVGWFVAEALAERGYALAIHYHRSAAAARETQGYLAGRGAEVIALQADLGDDEQAGNLVRRTAEHFGRLDVLVNCAAIWKRKRLEEVTAADVREHFEVNVLGTFLCAQQAGLRMAGQVEGGCIVNLGDWAEARPYVDYAAYFPSKGAVSALTRALAVELAARNPKVRVNCVLPGPVLLPDDMPEAERRQVVDATLLKREGRPQDVAQAVLFFVENEFVTGVCLPVDGGRMLWGG